MKNHPFYFIFIVELSVLFHFLFYFEMRLNWATIFFGLSKINQFARIYCVNNHF